MRHHMMERIEHPNNDKSSCCREIQLKNKLRRVFKLMSCCSYNRRDCLFLSSQFQIDKLLTDNQSSSITKISPENSEDIGVGSKVVFSIRFSFSINSLATGVEERPGSDFTTVRKEQKCPSVGSSAKMVGNISVEVVVMVTTMVMVELTCE